MRARRNAYSDFVRGQYLFVPASTNEYLQTLVRREGFSKNDKDIVQKVADFVRKAAKYNADYDKTLDGESDIVVSFLKDYREGICQHYASAATLIYRALGIPARYTIGYTANAAAGVWMPVSISNAHAWTEVYIDGTGWVQVEVTARGPLWTALAEISRTAEARAREETTGSCASSPSTNI